MKTNKFAAGALALAMGLAAIAPAYADTKTETTGTTNNEIIFPAGFEYTEAGKAYIKAFNEWRAAVEKYNKSVDAYKKAEKAYFEGVAKLEAYHKAISNKQTVANATYQRAKEIFDKIVRYDLTLYWNPVTGETLPITTALNFKEHKAHAFYKHWKEDEKVETTFKRGSNTPATLSDHEIIGIIHELNNAVDNLNANIKERNDLVDSDLEAQYKSEIGKLYEAWQEAKQIMERAEMEMNAAKATLIAKKEAAVKAGADRKVLDEAEKIGAVTKITETTTTTTENKPGTTTTTTTTETVKPGTVDKGISAETRAKLEKAISEAEQKILAVKFLKETTPKTIAKVVDKLDKIVAEQEALIKSAKELLGQKAAFSLISTAYADDEKSAEEKAKELTDKLNENTAEIEKTLKENEANQGKDEKPADTKKPEEKPADTKKPAKKAGKNAKTGIAGVAGVAGVLAAASVAYATSKKNN